jgi:hypothetical protein
MAFSAINTPHFMSSLGIDSINQYQFPPNLKRATNDWTLHYGFYPHFCAMLINDEEYINQRLTGQGLDRHVAQLYIGDHLTQRYMVHQIGRIVTQLSRIPGLNYEKKKSEILVTMGGDNFTLKFFVCDESGFFHVLLSKPIDIEIEHDDLYTPDINKLILCIRSLLQNNDFVNALPDITRTQWFRHGHMTKMPQAEIDEVVPEWLDDDVADWNFPEIESETAPVLLGDILEMM